MAKKRGLYWRIIASMALVGTLACGCGSRGTVDSGGKLVSEEGQIAFTRATSQNGANIESDVYAATAGKDNEEIYTVNGYGSGRTRLTDIPGYDHWPPT